MEFNFQAKRKIKTGNAKFDDVVRIADMLKFLYVDNYCNLNKRSVRKDGMRFKQWPHERSKQRLFHYTCKNFDVETRLCKIYEDRPEFCKEYPNRKKCPVNKCTVEPDYGDGVKALKGILSKLEDKVLNDA